MKPMTDLCWVCQKNSRAIMKAANTPETEKSQVNTHTNYTTDHTCNHNTSHTHTHTYTYQIHIQKCTKHVLRHVHMHAWIHTYIQNILPDLLVVDLLSYIMITHPLPVAGKLPKKTLVARQLPTNMHMYTYTNTNMHTTLTGVHKMHG